MGTARTDFDRTCCPGLALALGGVVATAGRSRGRQSPIQDPISGPPNDQRGPDLQWGINRVNQPWGSGVVQRQGLGVKAVIINNQRICWGGWRSLAIAIAASGLFACGGAPGTVEVTAIAIARQQSTTASEDAPATAILEGTVEQRLPLLNGAVYRLKDDSGSLWIRTEGDDPLTVGDRLQVQVELRYQAVPVGDRDWGEPYAIERDRLRRQPAP